jgi:hypothetical protein
MPPWWSLSDPEMPCPQKGYWNAFSQPCYRLLRQLNVGYNQSIVIMSARPQTKI